MNHAADIAANPLITDGVKPTVSVRGQPVHFSFIGQQIPGLRTVAVTAGCRHLPTAQESQAPVKTLREAFDSLDTNKDGKLDAPNSLPIPEALVAAP